LKSQAKPQTDGRHDREYLLINKQRKRLIDQRAIHEFLGSLLGELRLENSTFSIVFVTDAVMKRYNKKYRGYDKATDVLSFEGAAGYLGDIVISSETAYNQALKSTTLSFEKNVRRLILHGLLHLMGYDHESDSGEMRALERRLRRRFQC
jgi:probable rRNA maturation factor